MEEFLEGVRLYHVIIIIGIFLLEIALASIIAGEIPHIPGSWELSYIVVGLIASFILCECVDGDAEKLWGVLGALEWTCSSIGFICWLKKADRAASKAPMIKRKKEEWKCPACGKITTASQYCEFCDAKRPFAAKSMTECETAVVLKPNEWQCSCGRVHPKYVSTCPCGNSKQSQQLPQNAGNRNDDSVRYCPGCGEKCDETMAFCPACGKRVR